MTLHRRAALPICRRIIKRARKKLARRVKKLLFVRPKHKETTPVLSSTAQTGIVSLIA